MKSKYEVAKCMICGAGIFKYPRNRQRAICEKPECDQAQRKLRDYSYLHTPEVSEKRRNAMQTTGYKSIQADLGKRQENLDKLNRARVLANAKLRGKHGFGMNRKGSLDHSDAKDWHVRDPSGAEHKFRNACAWASQNREFIESFMQDDLGGFICTIEERFVTGLSHIGGKSGMQHWRGWTLITKSERRDPLARKPA